MEKTTTEVLKDICTTLGVADNLKPDHDTIPELLEVVNAGIDKLKNNVFTIHLTVSKDGKTATMSESVEEVKQAYLDGKIIIGKSESNGLITEYITNMVGMADSETFYLSLSSVGISMGNGLIECDTFCIFGESTLYTQIIAAENK